MSDAARTAAAAARAGAAERTAWRAVTEVRIQEKLAVSRRWLFDVTEKLSESGRSA
jgi:hypothetical protein